MILRVGFYIDNITFHENKDDREELFNKPNSYKKIMMHLEEFVKLRKKIEEDINEVKLSF